MRELVKYLNQPNPRPMAQHENRNTRLVLYQGKSIANLILNLISFQKMRSQRSSKFMRLLYNVSIHKVDTPYTRICTLVFVFTSHRALLTINLIFNMQIRFARLNLRKKLPKFLGSIRAPNLILKLHF